MRTNIPVRDEVKQVLQKRSNAIGSTLPGIAIVHLYYHLHIHGNKENSYEIKDVQYFMQQEKAESITIQVPKDLYKKYIQHMQYEYNFSNLLGYVLEQSISETDKLWQPVQNLENKLTLTNFRVSQPTKTLLEDLFKQTNITKTALINFSLLVHKAHDDHDLMPMQTQEMKNLQLGVRLTPFLKEYLQQQAKLLDISASLFLENNLKNFQKLLEINTNQ
ncbi:hypothetical protein [Virgibacillus siamensis]|uniref:hypothetical protein n=1 Tax=Virgibacillus siamensis TaxID=480071 RepID=UPI000986F236|nr:hypothetical protein [Virgibacillus siamensis]